MVRYSQPALKSFAGSPNMDATLQFVTQNLNLVDTDDCVCCAASALDIAWLLAVQEDHDLTEQCYYHFQKAVMHDDSVMNKISFHVRLAIPLGFLPTKRDNELSFDISQLQDPMLKQIAAIYDFFKKSFDGI